MNLMFRKNFQEQRSSSAFKTGKNTSGRHSNKRSNRDQGYTSVEDYHYRTHLLFSPPRYSYALSVDDSTDEPRCGPMTGGHDVLEQSSSTAPNVQQPMEDFDLLHSCTVQNPKQTKSTSNPTKQVSFKSSTKVKNGKETCSPLSNLEKDCFIIPVHSIHRFLPAGVPVPETLNRNDNAPTSVNPNVNLQIQQVPDPKLYVLCHLMHPLESINSILESPLVQPLLKQRMVAGQLLDEIAEKKDAITGMLLANMERNSEFPFISYYIVNTAQVSPATFYNNLRTSTLTKFDPRTLRYTTAHSLDLYSEVATICRPPIYEIGTSFTKIHSPTTGYIVSIYKVFDGDDKVQFERNWLYWTGARIIFRYMPESAGLRKMSLYKSLGPKGDKMYILFCEFENLLANIPINVILLPALRARLIGYTGIFKPIQIF